MLLRNKTSSKMSSQSLHHTFTVTCFVLLHFTSHVLGHGRLVEPPSRSSMWRFGFKTKPNYNDNELFCGGYTVHWQRNGGKCGVCGDAWHLPQPRPNEAGGIYGQGVISRKYSPGQIIRSTVDITANHRGFFEFKLCPHNNPSKVVSQECLDHYPLELADGSGTKYYPAPNTGPFNVQLRLPSHVTCSQCVFQWTYTAGNNWGRCENGTSKVGCGPQETFRGCADVAIGDVETNDIPTYNNEPPPPPEKPSISAIPPRRSTYRPRYRPPPRPRPTRPSTTPRPIPTRRRPSTTPRPIPTRRRPSYNNNNNRPTTSRRPVTRKSRPYRPTSSNNIPSRAWTTRRPFRHPRPTTYRPIYTPKPTPYRPLYSKSTVNKKSRPTFKPKVTPPKKSTNIETEGPGGCRAVGVWASIAGIASWCDSNCARGYCPSSHCDCS